MRPDPEFSPSRTWQGPANAKIGLNADPYRSFELSRRGVESLKRQEFIPARKSQ